MVKYDDWGNEKPPWSTARVIRLTVGTVLLLGAVGGAAYGIYSVTHKNKNHNSDNGSPGSPGTNPVPITTNNYTFPDAMQMALLYLNAQKSGKLPSNNPITWRGDSCLKDGSDVSVDLAGGLYDAGDHIKFGLPMAFTSTMLAWGILEYGTQMHAVNQMSEAVDIVKWITDYLMKCHTSPNEYYFQVGDPDVDHKCWQRAEDVDQSTRLSSKVDTTNPGSDVAGEAAAALAAASIIFRRSGPFMNTTHADDLLSHSKDLFDFAKKFQGKYSDSFPKVGEFYNSTGYEDELLWAASWLYEATGDESYMEYVTGGQGQDYAGWDKAPLWLSWDDKRAGVQVLLSRNQLLKPSKSYASELNNYKKTADKLMCAFLPFSPTATAKRTDGGMLWVIEWSASVETVNAAFLSLVYSDYLRTSKNTLTCGGNSYSSEQLRYFAYSQVDYLLGKNPIKQSYLVGYGDTYPQYLHHRGASIPDDGKTYDCNTGFEWLESDKANPNVAKGALVGGPFFNETFIDLRNNTQQNEAGTYNSATLAGLVAGLSYPVQGGVLTSFL